MGGRVGTRRRPVFTRPINEMMRRRVGQALPPHIPIVGQCDIREYAIRLKCVDCIPLVIGPVPGATPKNPASGLIARSRPFSCIRSQQMSSPRVSTVQPASVDSSIAMFVFPHAEGNAAAIYLTSPFGEVTFTVSMCSASHPSSRPMIDAIRSGVLLLTHARVVRIHWAWRSHSRMRPSPRRTSSWRTGSRGDRVWAASTASPPQ